MTLSMMGLILGLVLLIVLTLKGMNILIAAPLCALVLAITSHIPIIPPLADNNTSLTVSYMTGFASFLQNWFIVFLLGAMFGKVMEISGAADSLAHWIMRTFGSKHAPFAIVLTCAILTYGGVSVFVVAFSVFPMALSLFKDANLPRRFIPAALAFGSITFTMTSAGSVEIQNFQPMQYLGTDQFAGWPVSLVVALFMASTGMWLFHIMIKRAVANGERFDDRENDPTPKTSNMLPHPFLCFIPLILVLSSSFYCSVILDFGHSSLIIALLTGLISAVILYWKRFVQLGSALSLATYSALIAIANTCAVVGFGSVAKLTPAFNDTLIHMTSLPGNGLISAAIAISVIVALTGSASGGQAIALPLIAPHYLEAGVDPNALHRVIAITSGGLDSLPHNGYVITTIRVICGETHKTAYLPLGALTVLIPFIGAILAIILFILSM
ncbi:GntP family permease [uncultured Shewanella sp.]|uniref:GntP family permease n=1 Tax=uncultured Shewanella sp. TaxID=173975 RepID=UPI00261C71F4|nr:GntP family permease [uncultured Shewanella sp.]